MNDLENEVAAHHGRLRPRPLRNTADPLYGLCIFEAFADLLFAAGHEQPSSDDYAPFLLALPGTTALHLSKHAEGIIMSNTGIFGPTAPKAAAEAASALAQALLSPISPVSHSIAVLAVLCDLYDVSIEVVRARSGVTTWFRVPSVASGCDSTIYIGTILATDTLSHDGVLHAFSMQSLHPLVPIVCERPPPLINVGNTAFRGSARDDLISTIAKRQVAVVHSRVLLATPGASAVVVFTDGAVPDNGKGGTKGGIGIHCETLQFPDFSRGFNDPSVTNNTMELTAAIEALKAYEKVPFVKGMMIHLRTDSSYVLELLRGNLSLLEGRGWRTTTGCDPPNLTLLKHLTNILKTIHGDSLISDQLIAEKVKAHSGIPGNVRADALASAAAAAVAS
jgi:ribonuclease HI